MVFLEFNISIIQTKQTLRKILLVTNDSTFYILLCVPATKWRKIKSIH